MISFKNCDRAQNVFISTQNTKIHTKLQFSNTSFTINLEEKVILTFNSKKKIATGKIKFNTHPLS